MTFFFIFVALVTKFWLVIRDGDGKKNGNNIIEGNLQIMGPSGLMAFAAVLIAIHPVLDGNNDANNVNGGVKKKHVTWKPVVA